MDSQEEQVGQDTMAEEGIEEEFDDTSTFENKAALAEVSKRIIS